MEGKRSASRHRTQPRFRGRSAALVWLAAVCLAASLTTVGYANGPGPKPVAPATDAGLRVSHRPVPSASASGAAGGDITRGGAAADGTGGEQLVATTGQGLLELLSRLMPPGEITGAYQLDGPGIALAVRFTRGGIHTYFSFSIGEVDDEVMKRQGCADYSQASRCTVLANGATAHLSGQGTCESPVQSTLQRVDRLFVMMTASLCGYLRFPPYTKPSNPTEAYPLRPVEMELLTADDQWAVNMPADLVEAGRQHFPTLRKATQADFANR